MFDDPRWDDSRDRDDDRDRDSRDRDVEPRDVFMEGLDLPRGLERELVHERDREYTLRGSESRAVLRRARHCVWRRTCRMPRIALLISSSLTPGWHDSSEIKGGPGG